MNDQQDPDGTGAKRGRRFVLVGVVTLTIAIAAWVIDPGNLLAEDVETSTESPTTVPVALTRLGEEHSADGTLEFADSISLVYTTGEVGAASGGGASADGTPSESDPATVQGALVPASFSLVGGEIVSSLQSTSTTTTTQPTTTTTTQPPPSTTTQPPPSTTTQPPSSTTTPTPTQPQPQPPSSTTTPTAPPAPRGGAPGSGTGGSAVGDAGAGGGAEVTPETTAIVSEIAQAGDRFDRGDVLWRIDDVPTSVLIGDIPAYRDLEQGDEGPDVLQLEENLVALGYDSTGAVTVDETYSSATTSMVRSWQEDVGLEETGDIAISSVVIAPTTGRVESVSVAVGDIVQSGDTTMAVTSLDRELRFPIAASELNSLSVGDLVSATLPDRTMIEATVTHIGAVVSGTATVTATPIQPVDYPVNSAPASVEWTIGTGDEVLVVPAGALLRTDNGQYYLDVVAAGGNSRSVPVAIGENSGSSVEVSGDIAEGDEVVAP